MGDMPSESGEVAQDGIVIKMTPEMLQESDQARMTGHISKIQIDLVVPDRYFSKGLLAFTMRLEENGYQYPDYEGNPILAFDIRGHIGLQSRPNNDANPPQREWWFARQPQGVVKFSITTIARQRADSELGDFLSLLEDESCLVGSISTFIPRIPFNSDLEVALAFDLDRLPPNCMAVWSWGEFDPMLRPLLHARGSIDAIWNTVIAVGKLEKYPSHPNPVDSFGAYWAESSASFFKPLGAWALDATRALKQSLGEPCDSFRLFLVRNPKGSGARTFAQSCMLSFNTDAGIPLSVLKDTMVRLSVKYSLRLTALPNRSETNRWFNDGIGLYYATLLPVSLSGAHIEDTVLRINRYSAAHYTSKAIYMTIEELDALPEDQETRKMDAEFRGFMYFINLSSQLGPKFDLVMKGMAQIKRAGMVNTLETWKGTIAFHLGQPGLDHFKTMMEGRLIKPDLNAFKHLGIRCKRDDLYGFDLGFPEECIDGVEKVYDVVQGSRAAQAGLRNGDLILNHMSTSFRPIPEEYTAQLVLNVRRNGETVKLQYWPRSHEKVKAYKWEVSGDHASQTEEFAD